MILLVQKAAGLVSGLFLALILLVGCGEGEPDTSAEAAEIINESSNGLVKIAEGSAGKIVSKYLTPRYLATAEAESRGSGKEQVDSLTELYSRTMSFHIAVSGQTRRQPDPTTPPEGNSGVTFEGVGDVEVERGMFSLRCGDSLWHPVAVLPESRVGEADQLWFVVFAVDPRTIPTSQSKAVLTYMPPDGAEDIRFTYTLKDFIRPEFIASIN